MWAEVDNMLAEDVAYIPLDITKFYYLHGSNVENYVNSVSTSGYPDLGCHLRQELTQAAVTHHAGAPRGRSSYRM